MQVPAGGRRLCGCGSWLSGDDAAVPVVAPANEPVLEAAPAEEKWPKIEGDLSAIERLNDGYRRIRKELAKPKEQQQIGDLTTQAYLAYILSLEHRFNDDMKKWLAGLYEARGDLNNYGRALLALAMHHEKKPEEAKTLLRNSYLKGLHSYRKGLDEAPYGFLIPEGQGDPTRVAQLVARLARELVQERDHAILAP